MHSGQNISMTMLVEQNEIQILGHTIFFSMYEKIFFFPELKNVFHFQTNVAIFFYSIHVDTL